MFEKLLAAIEALTAALNANTAARTGEPAAPEAPKKTRAQKAVETAQANQQPQPETAAPNLAPTPGASIQGTGAPAVTMEEAISLTKDLAKKDRDAAVATLKRHGAGKATELKAEVLSAYVADVKAQLAPAAGDGLI